jgi:hypothetical protein
MVEDGEAGVGTWWLRSLVEVRLKVISALSLSGIVRSIVAKAA